MESFLKLKLIWKHPQIIKGIVWFPQNIYTYVII